MKGKNPTSRVFASPNIPKGKSALVAYTSQVGATAESIPQAAHGVGVAIPRADNKQCEVYISQPKMVVPKSIAEQLGIKDEGGMSVLVPFWLVRYVPDSARANAELSRKKYQVATLGMSNNMFEFDMPIVTNTVPLKKGDEILLF